MAPDVFRRRHRASASFEQERRPRLFRVVSFSAYFPKFCGKDAQNVKKRKKSD